MYFNIYDDINIRKHHIIGEKAILIRILEPSYKNGIPYTIDNINQYQNVLELYLNDTMNLEQKINKEYNFDTEKAKILNNFILMTSFDEIVVHCSLGISRSPAIMICIAKILNNIELENTIKNNYMYYNSHIVEIFKKIKYCTTTINLIDKIEGNILYNKHENSILLENLNIIETNSSNCKKLTKKYY